MDLWMVQSLPAGLTGFGAGNAVFLSSSNHVMWIKTAECLLTNGWIALVLKVSIVKHGTSLKKKTLHPNATIIDAKKCCNNWMRDEKKNFSNKRFKFCCKTFGCYPRVTSKGLQSAASWSDSVLVSFSLIRFLSFRVTVLDLTDAIQ